MNGQDLRSLVESEGHETVALKLIEMMRDPEDRRVTPEMFSLRESWEAFVGPVARTIGDRSGGYVPNARLSEAVGSTAFSHITGNVIAAFVTQEYTAQRGMLDQLTTRVTSTTRTEPMVGFQAIAGPRDVPEGEEYPRVAMLDKAIWSPEPTKRGNMIDITDEAVIFDQTGQVTARARSISRKTFWDRERRGMKYLQDLSGFESYHPAVSKVPTQVALFRASAGTEWYNRTINKAGVNALVDWTDVDEAFKLFDSMTDEAGDEIAVVPNVLLVPRALYGTALRITNATMIRVLTDSGNQITQGANVLNELSAPLTPMWSPFMNDTTTWYVGDFKSQYYERVIMPLQTFELLPDKRRDVVASFGVRYMSRVDAVEDKYIIQVPGA